jgi:hypothetical protein
MKNKIVVVCLLLSVAMLATVAAKLRYIGHEREDKLVTDYLQKYPDRAFKPGVK